MTKKKSIAGDTTKLIPLLMRDRFTDGTVTASKGTKDQQIKKLTVAAMTWLNSHGTEANWDER